MMLRKRQKKLEMKKKMSWTADADADADADPQVNMMGAQVVQGCTWWNILDSITYVCFPNLMRR